MKVLRIAQLDQLIKKKKTVEIAQELKQMAHEKEHGLETRQDERARVKEQKAELRVKERGWFTNDPLEVPSGDEAKGRSCFGSPCLNLASEQAGY